MTPEAKVKAAVKKILETSQVYFFMPPGSGYGRAGIPDIVGCKKGRFIAIECKAAKGTTTALQDRELQRITTSGGIALVINEKNLHTLQETLDEI